MHPKQIKDRAIVHYLHFRRSLRGVSRVYGLGKSTLGRWIRAEGGAERRDRHADCKYWAGKHARKLVVAVRGAGTMFGRLKPGRVYPLAPEVRGSVARARAALDAAAAEHRIALAGAVEHVRRLATLEAGVYRVGASGPGGAPGEEGAALHSEPDIDHRRLFLAVLPGNAAQVRERRDRAGVQQAKKM